MGFGSLRVPQQPNQLRVHFRRVRSQPPALSTAILVCLQLVPLPGLTCSLFVHSSVHCLPLVLFGVCYRRVVFPTSRVENTPYTVRGSYHPSPVSPIPFLHSPSPWGRFPLLNSSLVCEGAFVRTSALRVHYPGALLSRSFPRLLHRRSDDESQPKPHRSSPHHHQHRHPSHSSSLLIPSLLPQPPRQIQRLLRHRHHTPSLHSQCSSFTHPPPPMHPPLPRREAGACCRRDV